MGVEECGKRPADGARKAAKQCERRDCRASPRARTGVRGWQRPDRRDPRPCRVQPASQAIRKAGRECASARADRPAAKRPALTARTGRPPRRAMARPTQGETRPAINSPSDKPAHHPGQRPAGVSGDRLRQNRREVIGRSPGEYLRHPQHRDDDRRGWEPWTRPEWSRRRRCSRSSLTSATRSFPRLFA